MKKLLALIILSNSLIFATPFLAQAESNISKLCPISYPYEVDTKQTDPDAKAASEAEAQKAYEQFITDYSAAYSAATDGNNCGKPNNYTDYLEKSDCTAGGQVITEISEVIAPETSLASNSKNKIINVFVGSCCLVQSTDKTTGEFLNCEDVRTFYTTDFAQCNANFQNCERRQWVISDSGAGLIQVFVKQIYTWGAGIVGMIAVMTIILNGIKISASGVSGDITESKNKIFQAIAGIVLLFLSSLILYTVNPQFFS